MVRVALLVLAGVIAARAGVETVVGADIGAGPGATAVGAASRRPVAIQAAAKTTLDKVYTKEQATKGAATYEKVCSACHDPGKRKPDKDPGPPLTGEKFFEEWKDRMLGELMTIIQTTMPNDGSAVLTEDEVADVVAHILAMNKMPEGTTALKFGDASKDIVIVPVK